MMITFEFLLDIFICGILCITEKEATELRNKMPQVTFELGFTPDETEQLKLSAPILKNKSTVLNKDEK
ncbi:MAG: hypothetical protein HC912_08190 [Saprospiraceae bacterium]|nr:hypothetical protein [Saprospiraceae bacterium]